MAETKFLIRDVGEKSAPAVIYFVSGGYSHNSCMIEKDLVENGIRVITFSPRFTIGAPYECNWDAKDKDTAYYFQQMGLAFDPNKPDFDAPYSFSDLAGDYITVLDQLSIEKAAVLGFSTAGGLAQVAVTHFPERLVCAVICASCHNPDSVGKSLEEIEAKIDKIMERMTKIPKPVKGDEQSVIDNKVLNFAILMDAKDGEEMEDPRAPDLIAMAKDDYANGFVDYEGMNEPRAGLAWALFVKNGGLKKNHELMKENKVPVLIVHGKADPVIPYTEAPILHENFANSELLSHDYGHVLGPNDNQKAMCKKIADFIKKSYGC